MRYTGKIQTVTEDSKHAIESACDMLMLHLNLDQYQYNELFEIIGLKLFHMGKI